MFDKRENLWFFRLVYITYIIGSYGSGLTILGETGMLENIDIAGGIGNFYQKLEGVVTLKIFSPQNFSIKFFPPPKHSLRIVFIYFFTNFAARLS